MSDATTNGTPAAAAHDDESRGFSRRRFLQALGIGATAAAIPGQQPPLAAAEEKKDEFGPGVVPITLQVNGQALALKVEPRVTLLDALRQSLKGDGPDYLDLTGSKRVCDRASCGACTVLIDGKSAYACTVLAIEAQGKAIRTVEGLEQNGKLHAVQEAFIQRDGLMCGFCTPGFIMSSVALLEARKNPTRDEINRALDGNICRCGTQCRVLEAVEQAARVLGGGR
jgi:xanthine dehydrogenase YagT iron-sulfur-binding subunit